MSIQVEASNLNQWSDAANVILGYALALAANLNSWFDYIALFKINEEPVAAPWDSGNLIVVWADTTLFDDLNVPWVKKNEHTLSSRLIFTGSQPVSSYIDFSHIQFKNLKRGDSCV